MVAAAVRAAVLLQLDVPDEVAGLVTENVECLVAAIEGGVDAVEQADADALFNLHNILRTSADMADASAFSLRKAADSLGNLLLRREKDATDLRLAERIEQRARELVDVRFADTDPTLN